VEKKYVCPTLTFPESWTTSNPRRCVAEEGREREGRRARGRKGGRRR